VSEQSLNDSDRCGYCDGTELVYKLSVRGGSKYRCIECLAIEQGQQQFTHRFEVWIGRDNVEPPGHPDAPDFEPFDPREHDYEVARAWFRVLARLKDDDPIIKRDPDATGTIFEDTREFLVNVMGKDAHKRPSELRSNATGIERSPFDAKPLSASEYIGLLESRPKLVLRVSDGTGDGTFRFWTESGELYWRCLNWFGAKPCDEVHLRATLDDEDATTQLLTERSARTDTDGGRDDE